MKLFGINNLENRFELGTVTKIEEALDGEFELLLRTWEAETPKSEQPTPTELHVHINGNVGQVIGKVEKMIQTKDKPENEN